MNWEHVPQIAGFLSSPIAGFAAAFLFGSKECTQLSPDGPGPFDTGTELCSYNWNEQAGVTIALIGFAVCGVWLAITIWLEHQN